MTAPVVAMKLDVHHSFEQIRALTRAPRPRHCGVRKLR
jgi:hypothetical protein